MGNLKQKIETVFLDPVKNYTGRVRNSAVGKVAFYSLVGLLSAGAGYGCGGEGKGVKDITQTPEIFQPKDVQKGGEEPQAACWDRAYGWGEAYSIQQTNDLGYIVAGWAHGENPGAWVLKLDLTGDLEWDKILGGSDYNVANSIHQTTDGGYIVASRTGSQSDRDAWILKFDSTGNLLWDKTFGESDSDLAHSIQQTTDDGYIVAGKTENSQKGIFDDNAWVFKLDSIGNVEWDKTFGGSKDEIAASIQQTTDLGYIVAGKTETEVGGFNTWIFKLDSTGSLKWDKTYWGSDYGSAYEGATSIQQTTDGGYIVSNIGAWVLKLNSAGELEWNKTFGEGGGWDSANSIQQTTDLGYIVAGTMGPKGIVEDTDAWVLKLDSKGGVEWDKTFGGCGQDMAYSIQQISGGGYIVAGLIRLDVACEGAQEGWVFKLDKDGNLECE